MNDKNTYRVDIEGETPFAIKADNADQVASLVGKKYGNAKKVDIVLLNNNVHFVTAWND